VTRNEETLMYTAFALMGTATTAAQLHRRVGRGIHTLTLAPNEAGTGWTLADATLTRTDGDPLPAHLDRPVDESSPFADHARERLAAANELAGLLAEMPFDGEPLAIPLYSHA
jgi:hypothetical protein